MPDNELDAALRPRSDRRTGCLYDAIQHELRLVAGVEGQGQAFAVDGVGGEGLVDAAVEDAHRGLVAGIDGVGFNCRIARILVGQTGLAQCCPQERYDGLTAHHIGHASRWFVASQPIRQGGGLGLEAGVDATTVEALDVVRSNRRP
ncbi:hypothetical protein D3C76_218380 [compost metagenome]